MSKTTEKTAQELDMAQLKQETEAAAASIREEERVEIHIPRAVGNEEPDLFVSVNGMNFLLPKGQKHMVPKSVAAEIYRSWEAQRRMDKTIDNLKNAGNQPT